MSRIISTQSCWDLVTAESVATLSNAQGMIWRRSQKESKGRRMQRGLWTGLFWTRYGCCIHELRAVLVACTRLDPPTVYRGWGGAHEATPPEELQAANVPGDGGHIPQWYRHCKAALAQVDNTRHHAHISSPTSIQSSTKRQDMKAKCGLAGKGFKGEREENGENKTKVQPVSVGSCEKT